MLTKDDNKVGLPFLAQLLIHISLPGGDLSRREFYKKEKLRHNMKSSRAPFNGN